MKSMFLYQCPYLLARLIRAVLAWPRILLRHPSRSLMITALMVFIGAGSGVAGVWFWASYHLRMGRMALERYHTAEAVPHLQAALSIWPNDPETLLLAARAARRSGSFEIADRLLDSYQELGRQDENLTLERVCLRAERGEPDSVSKSCRTFIEQDHPGSPLLFEALVRGYMRVYQPLRAEKLLNEWLQRQPDNPQALFIQGQILDLQMRQTESIQSYRAALTVDPTLDEARLRLCDALMQLGSIEEAQPHLVYLHRRLPNHLMLQVYLARIQDRQGHPEEAERMLEAVLASTPTSNRAARGSGRTGVRRSPMRIGRNRPGPLPCSYLLPGAINS
jgi:tetratricopeptide (TPR) repeat protein